MFPRHIGHYNAGWDKSDNNLPAMLCYSGREWALEKQDIPLCFGFMLVVLCPCRTHYFHLSDWKYVSAFSLVVMGCIIHLFHQSYHTYIRFCLPRLVCRSGCGHRGQMSVGGSRGSNMGSQLVLSKSTQMQRDSSPSCPTMMELQCSKCLNKS